MFEWLWGPRFPGKDAPVTVSRTVEKPLVLPVDPNAAERAGLKWCECRKMYGGCMSPAMCRI